jgi:RNA polymerase sigma-54 factor
MAAFMLTHLDEDGFLTTNLVEIAQYCHVSLDKVRKVKSLIMHADPIGVGAENTREALLCSD